MKKTATLIVALCAINLGIKAQVGIGNNFPNDSTILDLTNLNNKGLLLPKTNGTLPNPTSDYLNGMLLFSDADSLIYLKTSSSTFNGITPWKYKVNAAINEDVFLEYGNVGIGYPFSTPLSAELDVNGDINAQGKVKEFGNALVPRGVIVMWAGNSGTIPAGWALCTGSSQTYEGLTTNTPNLSGRFILGYQAGGPGDYNSAGNRSTGGTTNGDLGGSIAGNGTVQVLGTASFNITTANLPSHTHSSGSYGTSNDGNHNHDFENRLRTTQTGAINTSSGSTQFARSSTQYNDHPSGTDNAGNHSHSVNGTSGSTGSGTNCTISTSENDFNYAKPRYYTLAYIIKL